MSKNEMYKYFLEDLKRKEPKKITLIISENLQALEKIIVAADVQNYNKKGNNNSVKLSFETNHSIPNIKYTKTKLLSKIQIIVYKYFISQLSI